MFRCRVQKDIVVSLLLLLPVHVALVVLVSSVVTEVEAAEVELLVAKDDSEAPPSALLVVEDFNDVSVLEADRTATARAALRNVRFCPLGVAVEVNALLEEVKVEVLVDVRVLLLTGVSEVWEDEGVLVETEVTTDAGPGLDMDEEMSFVLALPSVVDEGRDVVGSGADVPSVRIELRLASGVDVDMEDVDTLLLASVVKVGIGIGVEVVCWEVIVGSFVVKLLVLSEEIDAAGVEVLFPPSVVELASFVDQFGVESEADDVEIRLVLLEVSVDSVREVVPPDSDVEE
ncbi:unnamed protein product, partial [Mesorhabditis spiculigera]